MHQTNTDATPKLVTFTLNGQSIAAPADKTILQIADERGIDVPRLCYMEGMRPDGNCRTCMVEIKGERVLAASCCRYPKDGMEVTTDSPRAVISQKMSIELLLSDVPETSYTLDSELDVWAKKMGVGKPRFGERPQPSADLSHPAIAVHLDACIQCKRCVRACREEQVNDVIGYAFRGGHSKIVFDLDDPMGHSTCVACGECVQACPTGALMPARDVAMVVPDRRADTSPRRCDNRSGEERRLRLSVLRRRVSAHLQRQRQPHSLRPGHKRSGQLESSVRQGALRIRLRSTSPPTHHTVDPQEGRAEAQELHGRSREVARGVS